MKKNEASMNHNEDDEVDDTDNSEEEYSPSTDS